MLHEEQTVCNTACLNNSSVDLPCTPGKAIIWAMCLLHKKIVGIVISYSVQKQLNSNIRKHVMEQTFKR